MSLISLKSRPRQESRHGAGGDRSESTSSGQPTNYAEYKAIGVKRCLHMQWG